MTPARIPLHMVQAALTAQRSSRERGGYQLVAALAPTCRYALERLDLGGIRSTHYAVWTRHRPERAPWLDGLHAGAFLKPAERLSGRFL